MQRAGRRPSRAVLESLPAGACAGHLSSQSLLPPPSPYPRMWEIGGIVYPPTHLSSSSSLHDASLATLYSRTLTAPAAATPDGPAAPL